MTIPKPTASNTIAMRKRNAALVEGGWRTSTIAFSPKSLEAIEKVKNKLNLSSREAAVNAVFERLDDDMFLRQEFLAVAP